MKGNRILVVEDDPLVKDVIEMTLRRAAYDVMAVSSGLDAKAILSDENFDVIVTDILLPDSDGFDVIELASRTNPEARVIAMSGGGEHLRPAYLMKIGMAVGATTALVKPFTIGELLAAVRGNAGRRTQQAEPEFR